MFHIRKLIDTSAIKEACNLIKQANKRIVFTNGCFDVLHAGHVYFLRQAASCGNFLIVGVNSDLSIKALKGPTRPIYLQEDRLFILNELTCVDGLVLCKKTNFADFIKLIKPDVYVKAGDYSIENMNVDELNALKNCCADIKFLDFIDDHSTTKTIQKIKTN